MANFELTGAPTKKTVGAIGDICTNTVTGTKYECVYIYDFKTYKGTETEYEWQTIVNDGGSGTGGGAVSPTIAVSEIDGGHRVTVTDVNGSQNFDVLNGAKGDKGDTGLTGPAGPKGADGAKGDKGDTGLTGPAGPKGADGAKGDKGDTGLTGPAGPKGDKGDTGLTGPAGPKGDDGADGADGAKGDKGDTGLTGPAGPTGPKGADGITPVKGVDYFTDEDKDEIVQLVIEQMATDPE